MRGEGKTFKLSSRISAFIGEEKLV